MSITDALSFITAVGESAALQEQINQLRGRSVLEQLVELGRERGYHFSVDEYRDAVVSMAGGELSDESLDEVLRETGLK
jgi:predicted ribosomally synthesized peptide with nif11-like leader